MLLPNNFLIKHMKFVRNSSRYILGIESTFNDTGAAIVDNNGNILGEALETQDKEHSEYGGVNPMVAQLIHRKKLPIVVSEALRSAQLTYKDLSAIATATEPGAPFCLLEGLNFSKDLVTKNSLPFIPVHHMEAHILITRLLYTVDFPFLTLLASGGHCVICLAQGLGKYKILGTTMDTAPGCAFDKVARKMNLAEKCGEGNRLNTGADIEKLAKIGDRSKIPFTLPMSTNGKNCNMSFGGPTSQAFKAIDNYPEELQADIAAGFQHTVFHHIVTKLHRAILFCQKSQLLRTEQPTLVASGGVLCNKYLKELLLNLCNITNLKLVCPPSKLCTDNGVMIAWTGMEYFRAGKGICKDPKSLRFKPKSPLGEHVGKEILQQQISLPKVDYFQQLENKHFSVREVFENNKPINIK